MFMDLALNQEYAKEVAENVVLFQLLDAGIADMEEGKELFLDEAFERVSELRYQRRNARIQNSTNSGSSL